MTEAAKKEEMPLEDNAAAETVTSGEITTPEAGPEDNEIQRQAEEIARLKDQYLRAMAETENVRARARRDIEDTTKYAATKFAREMVGIVENLQRASASITAEARAGNEVLKQVGDGLDMTLQELLSVFERNGIRRISPAGQKFDHNFHQAVAQVESADVPPGNVLQVLQSGYLLHDRLLKPAMVTVATQPGKKTDADGSA
jgi:molecular chaperone GrpE